MADANSDGTEFIASDLLTFDDEYKNNKKNTHVINLFLEEFGAYEVLRPNLEYFIRAEAPFEHDILPSGTRLSDPGNFERFIEYAKKHLSEADRKLLIDRPNVLKEFNPIEGSTDISLFTSLIKKLLLPNQ